MSDYFESGFTVREPAWHGKGYVADRYPKDWQEAREWAGLLWEPVQEKLYRREDVNGRERYIEEKGWNRVARSDTGLTLAHRTDRFVVIDHTTMGEIVEALLEQPNIKYETAGATHGGRKVWALVMLDEPFTLPGDNSPTLPFLALTNHHDGTGGCRATGTTVKIVCANTFSAAEAEGARNDTLFSFNHTKGWRDRMDEARDAVRGLKDSVARYREVAGDLLDVQFKHEQSEQFIREFIPMPPKGLASDRVAKNVETARDALRTILAGPTSDGIADTAWGHVQAAGEYLDHYRRARTLDSRYQRQLLRPEKLKTRAVRLAREVAAS